MVAFGLVILVRAFSQRFAAATAGLANRADVQIDQTTNSGLGGQSVSGSLLGAVWSPCIGPTLDAAIALASTGESLGRAGAIMVAVALGVSTLILGLAYGAKSALRRRQALLGSLAERAKPIMAGRSWLPALEPGCPGCLDGIVAFATIQAGAATQVVPIQNFAKVEVHHTWPDLRGGRE